MRAVGALGLAALACATASAGEVELRRGGRRVAARVELSLRPGREGRISWSREGEALVGRAGDARRDARLRLLPDEDGLGVEVELRYREETLVEREAVLLRLPGSVEALRRDLELRRLRGELRVDRGTPVVARAGAVTVLGGPGVVAARLRPGGEIQLILDDEASHPFGTFARCRRVYLPHKKGEPIPKRPSAALERRRPASRLRRARGEVVRASFRLTLGDGGPLPVVERWPAGARAAVVIADHADRTDSRALRAVLLGASDPRSPRYGREGLLPHRIKPCKTFFLRPGPGTLADDPEARKLADEIVAAGGEVGPHSITPLRDGADEVRRGLEGFRPWRSETWIDHQPETNCEGLATQGTLPGPFSSADALVAAGYRWVWAATDAKGRGSAIVNLFAPEREREAAPPFFPLPAQPRLWLFRSSWFYDRPERLGRAISDKALDRLERERGLFVAHTYLSAWEAQRRELLRRRAARAVGRGVLEIDPRLEAGLARLGERLARGSLASLTVREAGERLRGLGSLEARLLADGALRLANRGDRPIAGLTISVPVGDADLVLRGGRLAGQRREAGRSLGWLDLAPGAAAVVEARREGRLLPLGGGGGKVVVEARR